MKVITKVPMHLQNKMHPKDNMSHENLGLYFKITIQRGINKLDEYIGAQIKILTNQFYYNLEV